MISEEQCTPLPGPSRANRGLLKEACQRTLPTRSGDRHHKHIHTNTYIYIYIYTCSCTYIYVCIYIYEVHVYIDTNMCIYIYIYIYVICLHMQYMASVENALCRGTEGTAHFPFGNRLLPLTPGLQIAQCRSASVYFRPQGRSCSYTSAC